MCEHRVDFSALLLSCWIERECRTEPRGLWVLSCPAGERSA